MQDEQGQSLLNGGNHDLRYNLEQYIWTGGVEPLVRTTWPAAAMDGVVELLIWAIQKNISAVH